MFDVRSEEFKSYGRIIEGIEITEIIAAAGIDIRALSIADTTDYGILRLIVDDADKAAATLKEAGITVSITNVIAVSINVTQRINCNCFSACFCDIGYCYSVDFIFNSLFFFSFIDRMPLA